MLLLSIPPDRAATSSQHRRARSCKSRRLTLPVHLSSACHRACHRIACTACRCLSPPCPTARRPKGSCSATPFRAPCFATGAGCLWVVGQPPSARKKVCLVQRVLSRRVLVVFARALRVPQWRDLRVLDACVLRRRMGGGQAGGRAMRLALVASGACKRGQIIVDEVSCRHEQR